MKIGLRRISFSASLPAGRPSLDLLYHFGSIDALWNGAWGLIRTCDGPGSADVSACLSTPPGEGGFERCLTLATADGAIGRRLVPLASLREQWKAQRDGRMEALPAPDLSPTVPPETSALKAWCPENGARVPVIAAAVRAGDALPKHTFAIAGAAYGAEPGGNALFDPDGLMLMPLALADLGLVLCVENAPTERISFLQEALDTYFADPANAGTVYATLPYAFGTLPIRPVGDIVSHGPHGLVGTLVVEPAGTTPAAAERFAWRHDADALVAMPAVAIAGEGGEATKEGRRRTSRPRRCASACCSGRTGSTSGASRQAFPPCRVGRAGRSPIASSSAIPTIAANMARTTVPRRFACGSRERAARTRPSARAIIPAATTRTTSTRWNFRRASSRAASPCPIRGRRTFRRSQRARARRSPCASRRNRPPGLAEEPLALWLHDLGFCAPKRLVAVPRPDHTFSVEVARRAGRFSLSVEAANARIAPAVFDIGRAVP